MNVIAHKTVAEQSHPAAFDILSQECEIDTPVRVARQDESPRIPTLSNMVRNISSN